MIVKLQDVCENMSSNLMQKDIHPNNGIYPIYGASGYIGNVDFYKQEMPYVAVVKDGAGIGRTMLLPEKSSIIGTMQYLIPKECILPGYLNYAVNNMHLEKYSSGATIPHIYYKNYKNEEFQMGTIEEQQQIVNILNGVNSVIDCKKTEKLLLEDLIKSRFVEMFGDPENNTRKLPILLWNDVFNTSTGKLDSNVAVENGKYPFSLFFYD